MSLLDDLPEGILIALDTVVWIYEVEAHSVFGPIIHPLFRDRINTGRNRIGSSLLALGELLVQPLALGRTDIADQYRSYFAPGPDFTPWDATREVVEEAAALRAKYRLKMMDAIHLASSIVNRADVFLSNDAAFRQVSGIRVVLLRDYVTAPPP